MDLSTQVLLSGLIGAVLGGVLSGFGAWLSIGRQIKAGQDERGVLAKRLMSMILGEQARALTRIIQQRATGAGRVLYLDIDRIQANYGLFERNREWLMHVPDRRDREATLDVLTEVQLLSQPLRETVQRWEENQPDRPRTSGVSEDQKNVALRDANSAIGMFLSRMAELRDHCSELEAKLVA